MFQKDKLLKDQSWITFLTPLAAVVTFLATYFLDPLKYGSQSSLAAIPSFLFSIIILLMGQLWAIHVSSQKIVSDSEHICETIKTHLQVTKVGTPQVAWKYIIDRLELLEQVLNTSFNYDKELERTSERLYESEVYDSSFEKISIQIKKGLNWKDIGDIHGIKRFRKLHDFSVGGRGSYKYKLHDERRPQIGFILLTYKDGNREVLFNWEFRGIPHDPSVLLSRDKEMFDMFAVQYNALWESGVEDYDNKTTASTSQK